MDNIDLLCLGQRIIDIDYYNAIDHEETPETISRKIENDPIAIIEYLLSIIEEYQTEI
jgi:hypothetical protein